MRKCESCGIRGSKGEALAASQTNRRLSADETDIRSWVSNVYLLRVCLVGCDVDNGHASHQSTCLLPKKVAISWHCNLANFHAAQPRLSLALPLLMLCFKLAQARSWLFMTVLMTELIVSQDIFSVILNWDSGDSCRTRTGMPAVA
jgi:hypothetical protein